MPTWHLLTITRGQGGQNAIGPEQDGELGVVRTEELLAAGQHYGVQQYFHARDGHGILEESRASHENLGTTWRSKTWCA